ncbi:glycosyltransferase family 2 protein [Cellulomonas fimi]|uniref:Glycosyl transferase family 2 n=2 Tax=Cellulomonas fimi TaxID=1708 RepID=F4GYN7_CELFA|nr:glycosyl transferase family 2 [Cellulomonas fimi ATCC 484]NNH07709.1 glycosyltransferase family 2 protein [Cellulomonas fimi]VEH35425.1 Glycosyl transferase family 2 [Cellulomonas fimi]
MIAAQGEPRTLRGAEMTQDSTTTGAAAAPATARRDPRTVVAALTYRRPDDLRAALPMLVEQAALLDPPADVLVVDNDPEGGAHAVVEDAAARSAAQGGPVVRYAHEPHPGIAAARNRALDESADHDVLVFIDDDERPVPTWLRLLVDVYLVDRPEGVVGPVVSEYEQEPDAWVRAGRFFDRRRLPTGTVTDVAATNNLLLDLGRLRELGLRFDERFGLSGGSDQLLTRQLAKAGGRMVWCDEAVVVDVVPPDRVTRRWVLARAFRNGNTWGRTSVVLADGPWGRTLARARVTGQGAVRAAGGAARLAVGLVTRSQAHQARGRRTWARGTGMIAGAYGTVYVEYARDGQRTVRAGKVPGAS